VMWSIMQASTILWSWFGSYRRAGCFKMQSRWRNTPEARSISILAPSCSCVYNLSFSEMGIDIDFTNTTQSGYILSTR
jgi:hypothetical protein